MSVIIVSPSNQIISISSTDISSNLLVSSSNNSSVNIFNNDVSFNTNIINDIANNNINISSDFNNANNIIINNNIPYHTHSSFDITNFNSSLSGLLPVRDIIGSSGVNIASNSGVYTISVNNLTASNNVSFINYGRLSLISNDPLNSNAISSTLYFIPYLGNQISLYDSVEQKWRIYTFEEISIPLSGMTPNLNYDIFCYYGSTSLILEIEPWASSSIRNIPLYYKDGVLVKFNEINKKYLGTMRSTSTTTTEDTSTRRFLFNYYNQIPKLLIASDNVTHTYASSAIRPYRNINTLGLTRVEFVNGFANTLINILCQSRFVLESATSSVGIALNSNTVFNTIANNTNIFPFGGPSITLDDSCVDNLNPAVGYNYLQLVQSGSNISTFYKALIKATFLC